MLKKFALFAALSLVVVLLAGCSPGSRPDVVSFTVDENAVKAGDTVWLSWMVEGADNVYIDNGVGRVRARGILQVMPDKITLFKKSIEGSCEEAGKDVYEEVKHVLEHEIAHHFGISDTRIQDIARERRGEDNTEGTDGG